MSSSEQEISIKRAHACSTVERGPSGPSPKRDRADSPPPESDRSSDSPSDIPPIYHLKDDNFLQIFSYLYEIDLSRCAGVSRRFYRLSNDLLLWKKLYQDVFEYRLPLWHPAKCEFKFRELTDWEDVVNPWKESFRQLRKGAHVRPYCAHIYEQREGFRMQHFQNLDDALEYYEKKSAYEFQNERLIFLHEGKYHPKQQIAIGFTVQIIGAGPSRNLQESVIIEASSGATITYSKRSSRGSYLGYCTVRHIKSKEAPLYPALMINRNGFPVIDHCTFSSLSTDPNAHQEKGNDDAQEVAQKSVRWLCGTVYVGGQETDAVLKNCAIRGSDTYGIRLASGVEGQYLNCEIAQNTFAGVLVKEHANPFFSGCRIYSNRGSGIKVLQNGQGRFERCDISDNQGGIAVCGYEAKPMVQSCDIHHENGTGIYVHAAGSGQFKMNRIFSNRLDGIWIASRAKPDICGNEIFRSQRGIYIYNKGRGLIEQNKIYENNLSGIQIRADSEVHIKGNTIHSGLRCGISVNEGGGGVIENNEIYGNTLAGISVSTRSSVTIRANRIHTGRAAGVILCDNGSAVLIDNYIFNNEYFGIEIKTGANPKITGNKIYNGKNGGVLVHRRGAGTLQENAIFSNALAEVWIESEGYPSLKDNLICYGQGKGICIVNRGGGVLEDNEIFHNAEAGVQIRRDSKTVVRKNYIFGGQTTGIEITDGSTATLEENKVIANYYGGIFVASNASPILRGNFVRGNYDAVERTIAAGFCLFTLGARRTFPIHNFYRCTSCNATAVNTICVSCIGFCHRGHDVEFVRCDRFICDCGAGLFNRQCSLQANGIAAYATDAAHHPSSV